MSNIYEMWYLFKRRLKFVEGVGKDKEDVAVEILFKLWEFH